MTSECAMVKLSYLIGKYEDKEKVKELIHKNMRGELTPPMVNRANLADSEFIQCIAESIKIKTSQERQKIADMLYPGIACNAAKGGNMDVLEMLKTLYVDL